MALNVTSHSLYPIWLLTSGPNQDSSCFYVSMHRNRASMCSSLFIRSAFRNVPKSDSRIKLKVDLPEGCQARQGTIEKFFRLISPNPSHPAGDISDTELATLAYLSSYFKASGILHDLCSLFEKRDFDFCRLESLMAAAKASKDGELFDVALQMILKNCIQVPKEFEEKAKFYLEEIFQFSPVIKSWTNSLTVVPDWVIAAILSKNVQIESLKLCAEALSFPLELAPHVQSLDLSFRNFPNWKHLDPFTTLKALNLKGTNIKSLVPLLNLKHLESLNLERCKDWSDLKTLSGLKNIKKLDISDTEVSDLSFLENLSLTEFSAAGCRNISDFSKIETQVALQKLNVENTFFVSLNFNALPSLSSLNLSGTSLDSIESLPNLMLTDLKLRRCSINHAALSRFENLESLSIGTDIPSLDFITQLKKLKFLSIGNAHLNDAYKIGTCTNLESLHLFNITTNALDFIPNLLHLTELTINICDIKENFFPLLIELPDIKKITVTGNRHSTEQFVETLKARGVTVSC